MNFLKKMGVWAFEGGGRFPYDYLAELMRYWKSETEGKSGLMRKIMILLRACFVFVSFVVEILLNFNGMKNLKNVILSVAFLFSFIQIGAQDITGTWKGRLVLPNLVLRIVFHISQTGQGGYETSIDSPDQGVKGISTVSTSFEDSLLTIQIPAIGASYEGKMHKDGILYGTFTQGRALPLDLERGEIKMVRPQEPLPPYLYQSLDVRFPNEEAGINLAGTLTLPFSGKNFPAVILITGSGPQNRDEEIMGHKPFWIIADYLTRRGIAVLRVDDRGVGESEGNFAVATASDYVTDVKAAFDFLQKRKDIDSRRIGVLGHSEGGSVAFRWAGKNEKVAFVVSLAGVAVKGEQLLLKQVEVIGRSEGMTDIQWDSLAPILRNRYAILAQEKSSEEIKKELYADVTKGVSPKDLADPNVKKRIDSGVEQMTSPWYLNFIKYDPVVDLKKVKCPVLALNGMSDIQVDANMNLSAIEEAVRSNGNTRVTLKKYPELNHMFQHCRTCTLREYGELEETISPEVLQDIASWIMTVIK